MASFKCSQNQDKEPFQLMYCLSTIKSTKTKPYSS